MSLPPPTPPPETDLPACYTLTLETATRLVAYQISVLLADDAPAQFSFLGSDDGDTWVELDWRINETWDDNESRQYPVTSDHAYLYYRLQVNESMVSDVSLIRDFLIFEYFANKTYSGHGESDFSQEEAEFFANQDAEATATADLAAHCRPLFTATDHSVTLNCPTSGSVTGFGNGASFISQEDADSQADEEAEAKANALFADCPP